MEFGCGNGHWNIWAATGITPRPRDANSDSTGGDSNGNLHLHLRHNLTVMNPKCEDKECIQKHSGSELSGLKSAELLCARHARLPVRRSHTLVNAEPSDKRVGRADEVQRLRRRNAELLRIQIHDHWT